MWVTKTLGLGYWDNTVSGSRNTQNDHVNWHFPALGEWMEIITRYIVAFTGLHMIAIQFCKTDNTSSYVACMACDVDDFV